MCEWSGTGYAKTATKEAEKRTAKFYREQAAKESDPVIRARYLARVEQSEAEIAWYERNGF